MIFVMKVLLHVLLCKKCHALHFQRIVNKFDHQLLQMRKMLDYR